MVAQVKSDTDVNKLSVAPRWPTRVFAIDCLLKILAACEGSRAHFDLALAKELNIQAQGTATQSVTLGIRNNKKSVETGNMRNSAKETLQA